MSLTDTRSQPDSGFLRCSSCGLPETYETIEFDEERVCNICRQKDYKDQTIDWAARKTMLDDLVAQYRGRNDYDCIVPFSGGKDSTFTLLYLMREYRLRPLVVQFNQGFLRPRLLENNVRTLKRLGVDMLSFTPSWRLVKRLMLETLIRKGDFCWHCHTGIFSYPMQIALRFNTTIVFWGEPSSEYTAYFDYRDDEIEEVDETRFNRFVNLGITAEDIAGMIEHDFELDPRDLAPYTFPKLRDLRRIGVRSVCLGSYIPWDVRKQVAMIQTELGWRGDQVEGMPWEQYPYEKIECYMQGVRDYIKYLKRGFGRVTQMTALDRRNGRMTAAEGERLIALHEGRKPPALEIFLEYLDISEAEFNDMVAKSVVPPNKPELDNERAPRTWDFDQWYREEARKRVEPGNEGGR